VAGGGTSPLGQLRDVTMGILNRDSSGMGMNHCWNYSMATTGFYQKLGYWFMGMGKYIQLRFTGTAPPRSWKHFVAFSRFSCFGGVAWGALGEGSITFKYRLHIQSMRSAGTRTGDIR